MSEVKKVNDIFDKANKRFDKAKKDNETREEAAINAAEGISEQDIRAGEFVAKYNAETARPQEEIDRVRGKLDKRNVIVDEKIEKELVAEKQTKEKPVKQKTFTIPVREREAV